MDHRHVAISCLALLGCIAADDAATEDRTEQDVTCVAPAIKPARSLAITDTAVLAKFSFSRVMSQVMSSAQATNTPLALYTAWMHTFAQCSAPGIDPEHFGIVCPRPESKLAALDPFGTTGSNSG